MCFTVTVMTFKAYVTAVISKLTYASFHKVGWEQPLGEVGSFVAALLQIYLSTCVPKIIKIECGLTKLLHK